VIARVLALLAAATLTMGAVVPPHASSVALVQPDRAPARAELATLTAAATSTSPDVLVGVRRLAAATTALDEVSPRPVDVASWWSRLAPATRSNLVAGAPGVLGNLDGVPYGVRDAANRAVLSERTRADEQALSHGAGRGQGMLLAVELTTLRQITTALRSPAGGPRRYLLTLDPTSAGRAAIAVGDVSTAKYVAFLVPGMYFTVRDQIVDWTDTAADVQRTETAWLRRLHGPGQAAVVSWIGYRTPDILNVVGLGLARQGASRLADAVNGLQRVRSGSKPFVSVIAHSYGATAALLALQGRAFTVDALALVGAPGSAAQSANDLAVRHGQVYVGEAALDGVATSGFFGSDPTAASYGAIQFATAGGTDPITHAALGATLGHNAYFAPGSESLRNIALVGIHRGDEVTGAGQPPARR
jgi:hypothetical protein